MGERSLQINISSVDDAKSTIANLKKVKAAYDAHGCTSVEFCIMENIVSETIAPLMGAIPWCKTFRRIVKPYDDNVFFALPHYVPAVRVIAPPSLPPLTTQVDSTPARRGRPKGRFIRTKLNQEAHGKTTPLVPAPVSGAP